MNQPSEQPNRTSPSIPQPTFSFDRTPDPERTVDFDPSSDLEIDRPTRSVSDLPGYEISGEIARGGMGTVLAARDVTLDREVAIKILIERRLESRDAVRFLREAKITAKLPHPGIPPVHALGTLPNGLPFLVMKLIRGRTLADLLGQRSSPQHDLSRFIQIFEQVAQAVGFAHAQGIIHRDLKPSNIMVGEFGEVQVMDWGLAKELQTSDREVLEEAIPDPFGIHHADEDTDETLAGSVMGTPSYMAPEQARGEPADFRADVFALGAILSVILTGKPPFIGGKSSTEKIRLAASADVSPAFQRLDASGADLELVALTKCCLSPRADDRFRDAKMVANATTEYRNGVEARLRKADADRSAAVALEAEQRKRRKVVQWAGGLVAMVLTLGIVGTTIGMFRAEDAKTAEAEQTQKALKAADDEKTANEHTKQTQKILLEIFADLDLRKARADVDPLEQVLAGRLMKAGEQLDSQSAGNPLDVAELQNELSGSLLGLGFPKNALPLALKSLGTRRDILGANHTDTINSMNSVAHCHYLDGNFDLAQPMYEEILRLRKEVLGIDHPWTLQSMTCLADCYRSAAKMELALPLYQEALQRQTIKFGSAYPDTLTTTNNLALAYVANGDYQRALPLFQEALKEMQALRGPKHMSTLGVKGNLALCYRNLEKLDLALPLLEEVMNTMKTQLGIDHPSTLTSMSNLALGYASARMYDRAMPLLEETLRLSRTKRGVDHPDTLLTMNNLAACYREMNKIDRAIPLYQETLKLERDKLGANHPTTLLTMNNLAAGYAYLHKFDLALPLYEEALKRAKASNRSDHPDTISLMSSLGLAYTATGKADRAIPLLEEVLKFRKAKQGADHPSTLSCLTNLAQAYIENNQGDKAAPLYEEFIDRQRQQAKPDDPIFAGYLLQMAPPLIKVKHFFAAEKYLREALAILEKLAPTAWATADTKSQLGAVLLSQKKYAEAKPLLVAGYEGLCKAAQKPQQANVTLTAALDRLILLCEALKLPEDLKKWQEEKKRLTSPLPKKSNP